MIQVVSYNKQKCIHTKTHHKERVPQENIAGKGFLLDAIFGGDRRGAEILEAVQGHELDIVEVKVRVIADDFSVELLCKESQVFVCFEIALKNEDSESLEDANENAATVEGENSRVNWNMNYRFKIKTYNQERVVDIKK